jgi:hypothetical protein
MLLPYKGYQTALSNKGRKAINQDFHGATIPEGPMLALKRVIRKELSAPSDGHCSAAGN